MSAAVSIIGQCPECCVCPEAAVEWDSRSASLSKDMIGYDDGGVFYTNSITTTTGMDCADSYISVLTSVFGGASTYSGSSASASNGWSASQNSDGTWTVTGSDPPVNAGNCASPDCESECVNPLSSTGVCWSPNCATADSVTTYEGEINTDALKDRTLEDLPDYDDDWDDTPGSYANLSEDGNTYSIRESRYRLRFKIPLIGFGTCYRTTWVERFIPEAGASLTSVEVITPGVYRPIVTLSAPPAGGTQAHAVAVMSTTGTVSSISILNPGSGYATAPTVTVQSATGGGTSSTGWTATLTARQVTAITGGSAGDYCPTLAFSGGGGSGATATCTLDAQGGISAVTLAAAGTGYTSEPSLAITAKVSGSSAAVLYLHLGTETARCAAWDGEVPEDYDPEDEATWPILGDGTNPYFELPVPTADGTTLTANVRAACDCTACP